MRHFCRTTSFRHNSVNSSQMLSAGSLFQEGYRLGFTHWPGKQVPLQEITLVLHQVSLLDFLFHSFSHYGVTQGGWR